jgi:hypothetical protein
MQQVATGQQKTATPPPAGLQTPTDVDAKMQQAEQGKPQVQIVDIKPQLDQLAADRTEAGPELDKFKAGSGQSAASPRAQGGPAPANSPAAPVPAPAASPAEPDMSGIANAVAMDGFMAAVNNIEKNWKTLGNAAARATELGTAANAQLTGPGQVAPPLALNVSALGASLNGQMDMVGWQLKLNSDLFKDDDKGGVAKDTIAGAANTAYHEARHGEQWHKMARVRAGQFEETVEQIQAKMPGMNKAPITDAHGKPLGKAKPADPKFLAWFESVYGTGANHRNKTLTDLDTTSKAVETTSKDSEAAGKETKAKEDANKAKGDEYKAKENEAKPLAQAANTAAATSKTKRDARDAKKIEHDGAATDYNTKLEAGKATVEPANTAWTTRGNKAKAWHDKKAAETQAKTTRDTADSTRVKSAQALRAAFEAFGQKSAQYQPLYKAFQDADKNATATPEAKKTARDAAWSFYQGTLLPAKTAYTSAKTALTTAENAFKTSDDAFKAAQTAMTTADTEWKEADGAYTTAITAYNNAKRAFDQAAATWTKVDGEYTTAQNDLTKAETDQKTAYDAWKVKNDEATEINKAWVVANNAYNTAFATWQAKWALYDAARKAREPVYAAYKALPEEDDAWKTGDELEKQYKKKYPAT